MKKQQSYQMKKATSINNKKTERKATRRGAIEYFLFLQKNSYRIHEFQIVIIFGYMDHHW